MPAAPAMKAAARPAAPPAPRAASRPAAKPAAKPGAHNGQGLTAEEITLVQNSFALIEPKADEVAALFYGKLFEIDRSTKPLFKGDMTEQGRKLLSVLKTAIASLHKFDQLVPALKVLGQRHHDYGVELRHYQSFAQALLWTLKQSLAGAFTPEVEAAWATTYGALAEVMMKGAKEPAATREFS